MGEDFLRIYSTSSFFKIPIQKLHLITSLIYKDEQVSSEKKINVILCGDYKIKKLNKNYRNKDVVTDVISFPFSDEDFLGEIYISVKRAQVQARRYHFQFEEEVLRLFIHGLLHLIGYDHIISDDRIIMVKKECYYLEKCIHSKKNRSI